MPIIIILVILCLLFALWIFTKSKNSAKFNEVVKDITEEQPLSKPKTGEIINKISVAEQALKNKVAEEVKEAERLYKEASSVGEFLASRGVVKPDKGKEGG